MPISAVDAINPAFEHAKQQLLKPFRFGQWVRLAFVGLLAGEMGSGGGCNFNSGSWSPPTQHPRGAPPVTSISWPSTLGHHAPVNVGLIALLVVSGLALLVLFLYISSVMRFVLFDSVIARECHIRKGWSRNTGRGFKLFVWQLLLTLGSVSAFAVVLGIPVAVAWSAGWFSHAREHILVLVLGGTLMVMMFVALFILLALIHVMTKDFVVPQMALEDISAMEAWRRLWPSLKAEKIGFGGYIGMKFVLAIGAGIVLGIAIIIVTLMLLIPVGGAAVAAVVGGKLAGLTWNFYTIALAVAVGCVAFVIFMFVTSMISVPTTVFFPAYSMYFFAARYPPLAKLLGQYAASPGPTFVPPGPPPFPPTPAPLG